MLYTIVPPEVIWQHQESVKAPQELSYRGQKILAQALPQAGQFKIVQLISTDPALFLDSAFQPGRIINFPAFPRAKQEPLR